MANFPARIVFLSVCLAALLAPSLVRAQAAEVLTNESVVQMVNGKVAKNLILAKIRSTSTAFDVTANALVSLVRNKVDKEIIKAMMQAPAKTESKEVLTNEAVVAMVTGDLPKDLILLKIQSTKSKFDLTSTGLISLSQNKVSPDVVKAMMTAGGTTPSAEPAAEPAAGSAHASAPAPAAKPGPAASAAPAARARGSASAASASDPSHATAAPKVAEGEAAILHTPLSATAALNKVKAYFNGKNIDFTVNADTNRIISAWYNERSCGPGLQKCANRANVRVAAEGGKTTVTVQVFERKREAGVSAKPWTENAKSKGKETAELAAALETTLK